MSNRRIAIAATAVLLLGFIGGGTVVWASRTSAHPVCTTSATRQLPEAVVSTVTKEVTTHTFRNNDTTLMQRQANNDYTAVAFADFEPKYCGFTGNINLVPRSERAKKGVGDVYPDGDEVQRLTRDGAIVPDSNDVCISNTVPSVNRTESGMEMTLYCDRMYPSSTWMQVNPTLVAVN